VRSGQLQPLVVPQLGQAWHDPARIICTPHCKHIGASCALTEIRAGTDTSWAARADADSNDGGSGGNSDPWRDSTTVS
jgi:hypothetical protein